MFIWASMGLEADEVRFQNLRYRVKKVRPRVFKLSFMKFWKFGLVEFNCDDIRSYQSSENWERGCLALSFSNFDQGCRLQETWGRLVQLWWSIKYYWYPYCYPKFLKNNIHGQSFRKKSCTNPGSQFSELKIISSY